MRQQIQNSSHALQIEKLPRRVFHPIQDDGGKPLIRRVLIANRGEIACRVISTCRKLDIVSVAVYTDPDRSSLHVREADEAIYLGKIDDSSGNPHQNIKLLIDTAINNNVDAIHPGYGYLSENADFSQQVRDAGLIFLGPSPQSMAVLGDKRSAKQYLLQHAPEIPLIPGYNGSEQNINRLLAEADKIGFPILIKASAGGGGKGMRIVRAREQLQDELERAQSEALRSFGSSDCIFERYIQKSKHIEMQIIGDSHNTVVSLLDRECSIQRRHQKIVEEAPSPWLSAELRTKMSDTAVAIGKLLEYESAGTVEFIVNVETSEFFFLEVNTRIQVEHPITEETTGVDIVALQIFVASGGKLDSLGYFKQGRAPQVGHAIEVRLCAEDPTRDFMPDLGTIWRWEPASYILGAESTHDVRFETGVATGSQVSVYFDPMISKIVVWAPTRGRAIEKMVKMLANTVCIGVRSNQLFLQSCLLQPEFHRPDYTTNFIPDLLPRLLKNPYVTDFSRAQQQLSFLPSILCRHPDFNPGRDTRQPFRSLPRSFRNQKADPANVEASVVRFPSHPSMAFVVEWPVARGSVTPHTVNIIAAPKVDGENSTKDSSLSEQLALRYNKLSLQIRALHTGANSGASSYQVALEVREVKEFRQTPASQWHLIDFSVSVDSRQYKAYAASFLRPTISDIGSSQKFFAHIPTLGVSIEYDVFSLLTYGESLRQDEAIAGAVSEASPKAPMPCKVLNVLKKNGEKVKIGDVAVVIESMKMEMKILATVEGVFKTHVSEGQAVGEGTVLFTIDKE
ncbi:carbamoyl-phosphate synthase L chain, ATP binding domain-containing protein [Bisporella sp. PMI_857]|nr:carbamoyl-phosphate synthase L chain, ATP binding domain-containing protein [Bisporella sp. PMI_857]